MPQRFAFLFPGSTNSVPPGVLQGVAAAHGGTSKVLRGVDSVTAEFGLPPVGELLVAPDRPPAADVPPEVGYLALLAASVSVSLALEDAGVRPEVLIGHSLGEVWAMTAAGGLTVADGARLVCLRARALRESGAGGGMLAVGLSSARTGHLVAALGQPDVAVACHNTPRQCVLSGPVEALDAIEAICQRMSWNFARLSAPYGYHNPALASAADAFREAAGHIRTSRMRLPVFSPVLGRLLSDEDDIVGLVAAAMTQPVRFTEAIITQYAAGVDDYVECGVGAVLTSCARHTAPGIRVWAPLADPAKAMAEIDAIRVEQATPAASPPPVPKPAAVGAPAGVGQAEAQAPMVPPQRLAPAGDREAVVASLRALYAEALDYPPEVLTEDAALEQDLGVGSLKQVELLTRAGERFGIPGMGKEVRLLEYRSLGEIADKVLGAAAVS